MEKKVILWWFVYLGSVAVATEDCCLSTNEVINCYQQIERTFVMIKPDAVQRGLVGEINARFERKGF